MAHFFKIPLIMLASCLLIAGCRKDNLTAPVDITTVPRTLGEFIENNYDLSLLRAALVKTQLIDSLKQAGAFTMYAPDNAAFNAVGIVRASDFDKMNTDSLRFMLKYHIMRDRYFVSTFPRQLDNKFKSLAGPDLYISAGKDAMGQGVEDRYIFVNGTIIMPDPKRNISLANGVIHILRRPLNYMRATVQDYIAQDTSLTVFSALMKKFGYWDALKTQKALTIYAPANAAFASYNITADSVAKMNTDRYKPVAFNMYTLQMRAAHIFSTDSYAIGGNGGFTEASSIVLDSMSVYPTYQYNMYSNRDESSIWIKSLLSSGNWLNNPYGPATVNYYKGYIYNADHLTENGIVHVVDQLFFNPALLLK